MSNNVQLGRRLKLTVFLIKDGYTDLADFLDVANLKQIPVNGGGTEGILFYRGGFQSKPPWVAIFENVVGFDSSKIVNQSSRGLLTIKVAKRWFCFTFGYSRQLIAESAIERNFGLIVTLNLGDPEAIKAIDKTNISHVALQSREQAGRDVSFDGFEFDTDIDLLKSITAKGPQVEGEEQDTYSGRDSISVYTRVELKSFADIAKRLFKAYENTAYLDRYPWIGKISQERDTGVIAQLDSALVDAINTGETARIWLALPEVVVWEQTDGFAYRLPAKGAKKAGPALFPDIDLDNWLSETGLKGAVTLPRLTDRKIFQCLKDDSEPNTWNVYRCLNAEVDLKGLKYILNDGDWYNVESSYVAEIDSFYQAIQTSKFVLPTYGTKTEPKYLKEVSITRSDITLMDRKLIMIGGGKSKIEFCDLFTNKKDIIHVKQYGGSSLLSHLFAQAVVSADCFLHEVDFRKAVNNHLPAGFKLANPAVAPVPNDYTICMAIMSKVTGPLEIPFFSKVSMKHAVRAIQKMGFKVTKLKIDR